jgi:hypothetical protein
MLEAQYPNQKIKRKDIKSGFRNIALLSDARRKYNDSTLNITNIKFDMRNLKVFYFSFGRLDAVVYDVFKCE